MKTPDFKFEDLGIREDDIIEEVNVLSKETENENVGLFKVKSANQWIAQAKTRPVPKMLFGEFWHEGELCILFADTNVGKSILAVQIADSISSGRSINGLILQAQKQSVLYFDFETSDKQLENRYSINFENHYDFDDNFKRVEINPDAEIPDGQNFEDYLIESLEKSIVATGAKILIIDNITYLKNDNEKAKDALPLMKQLKALKKKYDLSILVLAHTPKRDSSKPITRNDLQGSKMLINFCDSAFAIGESHLDNRYRYIKQIKQRNTEQIYGSENVCICRIDKPENFLQFDFECYGKESEHLRQRSPSEKQELITKVIELHGQGKSLREIGESLNISHTQVGRIIKASNQ